MLVLSAVILISLITAPLSCIILWHRLGNFADALIHSSIFAAVLSHVFGLNLLSSLLASGMFIWLLSYFLSLRNESQGIAFKRENSANVLYLSAIFMSCISVISKSDYSYLLFGTILLVDELDLIWLLGCAIFVLGFLYYLRREIVLIGLNEDLARMESNVELIRNIVLLMIILAVSIVIKTCGGSFFLVAGMLIPGLIARNVSSTPKGMITTAIISNLFISCSAFILTEIYDLVFAPLVVIVGFVCYFISLAFSK